MKTQTTAEAALLRYVAAKSAWREAKDARRYAMGKPCKLVSQEEIARSYKTVYFPEEDAVGRQPLSVRRICTQYKGTCNGPWWLKRVDTSGFCPACQAAWQANIAYREAAIELTAAQNSIVAVAKRLGKGEL